MLSTASVHSQQSSSTQDIVETAHETGGARNSRSRGYSWSLEAEEVAIRVLVAACRSGSRERGSAGFKSTHYQQVIRALAAAGCTPATRSQIKSKVDTVRVL